MPRTRSDTVLGRGEGGLCCSDSRIKVERTGPEWRKALNYEKSDCLWRRVCFSSDEPWEPLKVLEQELHFGRNTQQELVGPGLLGGL